MAELITPEEYFSKHLDSAFWTSQDEDKQASALAMAEDVIISLLPAGTQKTDLVVKAICEQAVYMLRNYAKQTEGKVVTSQSVGSISQSFTLLNGGDATVSTAAMRFINQIKMQTPRIVRISRG